MKQTTFSMTEEEADSLIKRVTEAIEYDLSLSKDDLTLLFNAFLSLMQLQERLQSNDLTIKKLRKLLGIVRSSEKFKGLFPNEETEDDEKVKTDPKDKPQSGNNKKRRKRIKKIQEPEVCHHKIQGLKKGDPCPECLKGKLYKYEPARLLRISGHTPFTPVLHLSERLRCNLCGLFFTAELPLDVRKDGNNDQKYGYSARALIAVNKYFAGSPFYRQESVQSLLGMSVTASTIFDQCEYLSNDLLAVFKMLTRLAANAPYMNIDDTSGRIICQKPVMKKVRNSDKEQIRTGVYTSGLIAEIDENHNTVRVVLFKTNIGHAGEFLDSVLVHRSLELPPPVLMSDALSANQPTSRPYTKSLCNSHARRGFADLSEQYPKEIRNFIEKYGKIWANDQHAKNEKFSKSERMKFHKENSLPVMDELKALCQSEIESGKIEANSNFGKSCRYFIRHYEGLVAFCHHEGAKIDNNLMESILRIIVLGRKNSYFYRTSAGAAVADIITSIIATCYINEINTFDYLVAIQQNQPDVKIRPELWLPWNYQNSIRKKE